MLMKKRNTSKGAWPKIQRCFSIFSQSKDFQICYHRDTRSRFLKEALVNSFHYSFQPVSSKYFVFQHSCPELGFGIAALKTLKQSYVCGHGHNSSSCANSKTKIASLLLQPCRLLNDNKTEDLQWIQGASLLWNSF